MTLNVLSVLARLGHDPWVEAGRLVEIGSDRKSAVTIAGMRIGPWLLPPAREITIRLIAHPPRRTVAGPENTHAKSAV